MTVRVPVPSDSVTVVVLVLTLLPLRFFRFALSCLSFFSLSLLTTVPEL